MRYRTVLRSVLILMAVVLAASAGGLFHMRIKARAARMAGPVPYTVTLREIVHNQGNATPGPEYTWAIRADGSRVIRIVEKKGTQRILNFASGVEVNINESNNTRTSMMRPNWNSANLLRDPNSKCLNSLAGKPLTSPPETLAGEEVVSGYQTAKIVSDSRTSWHALDYGCASVKEMWDFGKGEVSEKQLVALVPGEPEASLFEIPAGSREVSPSERIFGPNKECTECDEHTRKVFQQLDQEYRRLAVKQ